MQYCNMAILVLQSWKLPSKALPFHMQAFFADRFAQAEDVFMQN